MLRLYKPIEHEIFKLHQMLEHLVCSVWCEACEDACESKLEEDFKNLLPYSISKGKVLKDEIERIYTTFKGLTTDQKEVIKDAFYKTNEIEKLCNKETKPVYLDGMHKVVKDDIKPLFKWCYENLLDKAKVAGDKLEYYKALITANNFQYCPCCGLIDFESSDPENDTREAYDHYLPKSEYPLASVNFQNLVPLCYKCNSDRKKAKDPIENDRKAFYPFSTGEHNISIQFEIDKTKEIDNLERIDLTITLTGENDKIETWDWLFDIKERYNDVTRAFSKSFLRKIKRRHEDFREGKNEWTYIQSLDKLKDDYEFDKYEDKKFLKIAFLEELKNFPDLIEVYG